MRRAYKSGAADAAPSPTQATSAGFPREADLPNALPATIIGPWWFHMATEESAGLIEAAGLVPDDDPATYIAAVRALATTIVSNAIGAIVFPKGVTLASRNEHLSANPPGDRAATPIGVRGMIEHVVNGAPGALDTLNELAAALGDDPNFRTTMINLLAAKAPLANPTFTGAPKGPTPPAGDRSTRLATTAWLKANAGGIGGQRSGKAANYNVVAGDDGKIIEVNASAGARTVNLPDLAGTDNGFTVTIIKTDSSANAVTVDGHSTDTINGASTYTLKSRWESVILKWTGSVWIAIGGASSGWVRENSGPDAVLTSDIDIQPYQIATVNLSRSMAQYQGIGIIAGADASTMDPFIQLPRAKISPRGTSGQLLAVYAVDGNFRLHTVNPETNVFTAIGTGNTLGNKLSAALVQHDSQLFAVYGESFYSVNASTGVVTRLGPINPSSDTHGMGLASLRGTLYGLREQSTADFLLFKLDPSDGSGVGVGTPRTLGANLRSFGMTSDGHNLIALAAYRTSGGDELLNLFTVNPLDGSLTLRGASQSRPVAEETISGVGLAWHLGGLLACIVSERGPPNVYRRRFYAVNPTTGAFTARGATVVLGGFNSGIGLASSGTESGGVTAGELRVWRGDSDSSLLLRSRSAMRIHEVVGIA